MAASPIVQVVLSLIVRKSDELQEAPAGGKEMTALNLKLPPHVYRRLREEAARLGKSPQAVAQGWLVERLTPPSTVPNDLMQASLAHARHADMLEERLACCLH